MFVYSFLEKNLACAFLFDTVRLLILKGQRFFFNISYKKSKLVSINVTWPKIGIQYLSSSSFVKNSMQKNLHFILNSLDFWRILSPVRLFHHVRLLIFGDSPTLCDYFMLFVYLILKSTYYAYLAKYLHPYSRLLNKQHCLDFFLSRVIYVLLHTYWLFAKFPCGLIDFFIHGVCLIDSVVNV